VKTLEPVVAILREQLIRCMTDGVVVEWPMSATRGVGDWQAPADGCSNAVHVRFVPGCFAGDVPATHTFNGHANHNSKTGCRWGSIAKLCLGETLATDMKDVLFEVKSLRSLVHKKGVDIPAATKVTWHRYSREEMVHQATVSPDPAAVVQAQLEAANMDLSHAGREKAAKESGWGPHGAMASMLHDLIAFDKQMDVLIDGMHGWMNIIKPLAHMTVDIVAQSNEEYWLDALLQEIRRLLPGCFTSGRRVRFYIMIYVYMHRMNVVQKFTI